jgi:hypothetical protein
MRPNSDAYPGKRFLFSVYRREPISLESKKGRSTAPFHSRKPALVVRGNDDATAGASACVTRRERRAIGTKNVLRV